jgi:hypothetical protein
MPANIPNTGAISNISSQFNTNVFEKAHHYINKKGAASRIKAKREIIANQKSRNDWANSVNQTLKTAAKAHEAGVKSGRVAPQPGSAPRTFAMGPTPQQKAEAKTMQQQRNYAHGQAIGEQKVRDRMATKVNTPPKNPGQRTVPTKPPTGQFPQAKFPSGASTKPLEQASAAHSLPDKPQTFTQGAYTHKPGGIAAAGSRLEAWAQSRTMSIQNRRRTQAVEPKPLSGQAPLTKEE